ncbi:MAG: hypothetical protein QXK88_00085 [Desulfurococcaceae archaeon]
MSQIRIRDGAIEVDGSMYTVEEAFIHGTVSGVVEISKKVGLKGELLLEEVPEVSLEYPSTLVIRKQGIDISKEKLEICEYRKGLILNMSSGKHKSYEALVKAEKAPITISVSFSPRRVTIYYKPGMVEVRETPLSVNILIRPTAGDQRSTGV